MAALVGTREYKLRMKHLHNSSAREADVIANENEAEAEPVGYSDGSTTKTKKREIGAAGNYGNLKAICS